MSVYCLECDWLIKKQKCPDHFTHPQNNNQTQIIVS